MGPLRQVALSKRLAEPSQENVRNETRAIVDDHPLVRRGLKAQSSGHPHAWRIIHTWVKAQLALVEVNMVTVPQIFLPYAIMKDGRALSEHVTTDPQFLLAGAFD